MQCGWRWIAVGAVALAVAAGWMVMGRHARTQAPSVRAAAGPDALSRVQRPDADRALLAQAQALWEASQWTPTAAEQRAVAAWEAGKRRALAAYLRRAAQADDAQSQLDIALLQDIPLGDGVDAALRSRARRDRAIANAARADPDDPIAAWLEATACTDAALCDAADARRRLQRLFPDDAQVWLLDATDASAPGLDAALARAAQASRFTDRFDLIAERTDAALQRAGWPAPAPEVAHVALRSWGYPNGVSSAALRRGDAISVAAAMAFPDVRPLLASCTSPQSTPRMQHCSSVFARMADAGTLLHEGIATRRMIQLTQGTAQHAYWLERERHRQWRQHAYARAIFNPRLLELRLQMNEVDALDVLAELEGRPVTPPAGWQPRR